jgi:hypothetical protein
MKALAAKSGCMTCHAIEHGTPGPNGMAPSAPPGRTWPRCTRASRVPTRS